MELATRLAFARAVGEALAEVRKERGWNQAALAELCGISPTTLCRLESGVGPLDMDRLSAVCAVVGVPPHQLIAAAENAVEGVVVNRHQCALCAEWFTSIEAWCDHVDHTCAQFQARRGLMSL